MLSTQPTYLDNEPALMLGCSCRSNATKKDFAPVAHFKGFANVKKRDELSLMYAVWKHGPVAISLDASQPSFKFYSEGVYKEKKCLTKKVRQVSFSAGDVSAHPQCYAYQPVLMCVTGIDA